MSGASARRAVFGTARALADALEPALRAALAAARRDEICGVWLQAESSDFVRLNRACLQQAGSVTRALLDVRLMARGRQASAVVTLTADPRCDVPEVERVVARLRDLLAEAAPDPWLSFEQTPSTSIRFEDSPLPDARERLAGIVAAARGADLVGFHTAGPQLCAFLSNRGHEHWHGQPGWFFDWSVYAPGAQSNPVLRDKAVKRSMGDRVWDAPSLERAIGRSVREAQALARPVRRIDPGEYPVWLAPSAMASLVDMLGWGGFSEQSHRAGQSPLAQLASGACALNPTVHISEDLEAAGVPRFTRDGLLRPTRMPLIEGGRLVGRLVSMRSAQEFGVTGNGANAPEHPEALTLAVGTIEAQAPLAGLHEGLSVSDLWYLNFSDRNQARVTGMTRFATWWVEHGEPVAPVEVMRFDDSLLRLLGEELQGIANRAERLPDTSTYDVRGFALRSMPGARLRRLRLTL